MYIYDTKTRLRRQYLNGLFTGFGLSLAVLLVGLALVGFKLNKLVDYVAYAEKLQTPIERVLG